MSKKNDNGVFTLVTCAALGRIADYSFFVYTKKGLNLICTPVVEQLQLCLLINLCHIGHLAELVQLAAVVMFLVSRGAEQEVAGKRPETVLVSMAHFSQHCRPVCLAAR